MDFGVDSYTLEDVIKQIKDGATKLEEEIESIYSKGIHDFGDSWQGDSYDEFMSRCDSYRPALDSLVISIRAYAEMLENQVSPKVEELKKKINEILSY